MTRVALVLLAACGGGTNSVPAGAQLGPALAAAITAAETTKAPWRCAAADGPTLASETIGPWKLDGHTLARDGGELTIGAIADAGGAAPATMAAIGRLRDKLAKVDIVLALGGMGTTEAELTATLGAIADKGPLVVAMPGDLEDAGALAKAVAALRARGMTVVDGRLAQLIETGGASVAIVAGAGARGRTVAGDEGCVYGDTTKQLAATSEAKGIRIVASAEAPRAVRAGEPTGEIAIANVDVVLHGPTSEAASRATKGARDGDAVAVTPGTVDATTRLPDGSHAPTVGILAVRGGAWTWKPIADE